MSQVVIHYRPIDKHRSHGAWWRWLRSLLPLTAYDARDNDVLPVVAPSVVPAPGGADAGRLATARRGTNGPATGVVLPFPIHGEALLVKLAELLRCRVEQLGPPRDPLLLQIARCPRTRLSIDQTAYVEFIPEYAEYRAVIEAQLGTRVILETAEFDALVDFVVPYVATRLAEAEPEAAA